MRRVFIDPRQIVDGLATITDQEARHLGRVLRLSPGTTIELFDGTGSVHQAEILAIHKTTVEARIRSTRQHQDVAPFVSLAQGLLKGKKMDLVIQKATELGLAEILPVACQHSVISDDSADPLDRWQRIALEACKQSGRPSPPACQARQTLEHLLTHSDRYDTKILCWEDEQTTTLDSLPLPACQRVLLLIGPEGGFSRAEAEAAMARGFHPVTLGPRILRAETAAMGAMAIVQFLLGNLRRG